MLRINMFVLVFLVPFLLIGCSAIQPKEKTISGHMYIDPNTPEIKIEFPIDVSLHSEKAKGLGSGENGQTLRKTVLSSSRDNTYISINKVSIDSPRAYYTGVTNSEKEKHLIYQDKRKNSDGCFVFYKNINDNKYIIGSVFKRYFNKDVVNIFIIEQLRPDFIFDEFSSEKNESFEWMIDTTKKICPQVLDND